jgi:NAD(P)-dependent dehydrogenase (short-subunit alcohol dehydrogenase family)
MARILLTGATSGIGLATAIRLASSEPNDLIVHGPEIEGRVDAAISRMRQAADPESLIAYVRADFSQPDGPRRLAEQVLAKTSELDVIVNNAAIPGPPTLTLGTAGTELTYQVNFLAGTMLTHLLLPTLATQGRIVNVASATHFGATLDVRDLDFHKRRYSPSGAYAQSKLAIVTYTNWLASMVSQVVVSIHPGVVSTALLHAMFGTGGLDTSVGGANLASSLTQRLRSGSYLDESTPTRPAPESLDPTMQEALVRDTEARLRTALP